MSGFRRLADYTAIALSIALGLAGGTVLAIAAVLAFAYWGV